MRLGPGLRLGLGLRLRSGLRLGPDFCALAEFLTVI